MTSYREHIEKAINFVDDVPDSLGYEGVCDPESSCNIVCIRDYWSYNATAGYTEKLFLIVVLKTMQIAFHYQGCSFAFDEEGVEFDRNNWGYTFPTLSEVGEPFQPYYKNWLEEKGLILESGKSDDYPYIFDILRNPSNNAPKEGN